MFKYYKQECSKPLNEFLINPEENRITIVISSNHVKYNHLDVNLESMEAIRAMLTTIEEELLLGEAKMKLEIDPCKAFTHINEKEVFECYWVREAALTDLDLVESLEKSYGFGKLFKMGGKVLENGVYTYPQDDDLYPLIKITLESGCTFYQYASGIVAIVYPDGRETFVTRMD